MKHIIVTALIAFSFSACSEDESKDPFVGSWKFASATIEARFDIKADAAAVYKLENPIVNNDTWDQTSIVDASKENISVMGFNKRGAKGLAFYSSHPSSDGTIHVDSVYYAELTGTALVYTKFYNQVLTKN
jgi:hypothetical protein